MLQYNNINSNQLPDFKGNSIVLRPDHIPDTDKVCIHAIR